LCEGGVCMKSPEDQFIETILNLIDTYQHQMQESIDKHLPKEIALALSQYKEDAEKWREHVEQKNEVINAGMGRNPFRKEEG